MNAWKDLPFFSLYHLWTRAKGNLNCLSCFEREREHSSNKLADVQQSLYFVRNVNNPLFVIFSGDNIIQDVENGFVMKIPDQIELACNIITNDTRYETLKGDAL